MVKKQTETRYSGISTVEVALLLPLLLLLTFGVIHYGWLFLKAQQITNAARCGARVGIRYGSGSGEVEAAVINRMASSGINIGAGDITISPADIFSLDAGDPVTVRVTVVTADVALMNWSRLPSPDTLAASVTMAKEGP
jgi:Flp pilus assembly protein TadG